MKYQNIYHIAEDELQSAYEHVHHAQSLRYLEKCRLDYLISINFSSESFLKENLFLVINEINVRYMREIKAGDVRVTCDDVEVEGKKIIIFQSMYNEKQKKAIEARVTSMIMSGKTKRAVYPEEDFVLALGA